MFAYDSARDLSPAPRDPNLPLVTEEEKKMLAEQAGEQFERDYRPLGYGDFEKKEMMRH